MRTLITLSLATLSLFVVTLSSAIFSASNAQAATSIAVVNLPKIMREAKAADSVRTQVQAKQKSFQAELDQKEKELQKQDQDLAKQRSVLAPEAFEKKYAEFRKKAAEEQKTVRTKRGKLDKGFTTALVEIQKKVTEIVEKICKAKSYDAAISTTQVVFAQPAIDITAEVLVELDKQLPKLDVNFN
jgi:Skp family chaperone for outer membrane proteins